jgi:GNAT superfamily N-acetyltransferase
MLAEEDGMFRKAAMDDLDRICEIYSEIHTQEEEGKASVGWVRTVYPTRKTAEDSIINGDMFVEEEDGLIAAAAKINQEQLEEYSNAKWTYNVPDEQIMVLHTLVVSPTLSGKGYGSRFVSFYESYALEHGCHYLRMDTNEKNINARALYKNLGYMEADIVPCNFNGIPIVQLVCLEKRI